MFFVVSNDLGKNLKTLCIKKVDVKRKLSAGAEWRNEEILFPYCKITTVFLNNEKKEPLK